MSIAEMYIRRSNQEISATEVNLIAAEENFAVIAVAGHGGIIVVDFIDMHDNANKIKVYEKI
jgi:ribonuclease G